MSKKFAKKPIALALGATFALGGVAAVQASVFKAVDLDAGYMVSMAGDEKKGEEGKCGEGKCGGDKKAHKKDGDKKAEGKCGEGKCGGDKEDAEGDDAE